MDFTISTYKKLLESLLAKGYTFFPFKDYMGSDVKTANNLIVVLRHDVDRLPQNSLITAELENSLGINGTYYFRIVPESFDKDIIKKIEALGHEIGYHYEDVDLANKQFKIENSKLKIDEDELLDLSYKSFCANLEKIRELAEVKTVCMHGSPLSKFDNKLIWEKYNYRDVGIIGEPYLDIDWNEFSYLTDTGRKWNGNKVSVRDKISSNNANDFKTTFDIINNIDKLSNKILITVHPQRWNSSVIKWTQEIIMQNLKNIIKKYFLVKN